MLCPHCKDELTLITLPELADVSHESVAVELEYECVSCGKAYVVRAESKVAQWSWVMEEE